MKIVHIATSDMQGGAARAAFRLHRGLAALGESSSMVVKHKLSQDEQVTRIQTADDPPSRKFSRQINQIQKFCINQRRTAASNTAFSLPAPGCDLSLHPQARAADILQLHWVTELLSPPAIARLCALGRPVFWTLHDQRAFTGGCHYSGACYNYRNACAHCPQLSGDELGLADAALRESLEALPAEGLVVICPSRWMADCARRSALFARAKVLVVPNGIDINLFRFRPKLEARQQLGLPAEGVNFVFGADIFEEKRKGFALLLEAFRLAFNDPAFRASPAARQVRLLCFGDAGRELDQFMVPVNCFGHLQDDEQLARIYAAGDAFLLPSLEDNLPNTMLESMCCGTPVIGFDIGGLPDVIVPHETGLLVPAGDCEQLAEAIKTFACDAVARQRMSETCHRTVPHRFSIEIQARRYLDLYQSHLPSHPPFDAVPGLAGPLPLVPLGKPMAAIFKPLLRQAGKNRLARTWKKLYRLFSRFPGRPPFP